MTKQTTKVETVNVVKPEECSSNKKDSQMTNETQNVETLNVAKVLTNDGKKSSKR